MRLRGYWTKVILDISGPLLKHLRINTHFWTSPETLTHKYPLPVISLEGSTSVSYFMTPTLTDLLQIFKQTWVLVYLEDGRISKNLFLVKTIQKLHQRSVSKNYPYTDTFCKMKY